MEATGGPGAATTVNPSAKRNPAVRFEGRKHQETPSSRTRILCYRTANTTRAHGGTMHALIRYTAG